MNCPCASNKTFEECCEVIHKDIKMATTAEQLMRARYSAFVMHNIDFIYNSFHPTTRRFQRKQDIEKWAVESKWMQLNLIASTQNTVEFEAHYMDLTFEIHVHHEKSTFRKANNIWYYVDGTIF